MTSIYNMRQYHKGVDYIAFRKCENISSEITVEFKGRYNYEANFMKTSSWNCIQMNMLNESMFDKRIDLSVK